MYVTYAVSRPVMVFSGQPALAWLPVVYLPFCQSVTNRVGDTGGLLSGFYFCFQYYCCWLLVVRMGMCMHASLLVLFMVCVIYDI